MLPALLTVLLQSTSPPPLTPAPLPASAARSWPTREADFAFRDFHFRSGETLAEVRLHYTMLGQPHRNAAGEIDNAVVVLHGTGGSGRGFLVPQFANELFGPDQPLDIRKYWVILPDNIGHGGSSKPSDGLHMQFPHYDYDDMVELQHRLLVDALGLKHVRLIMGTSMGCMHSFVWGETYPDFARALLPIACEPVQIAGLNRMWRQLIIDGIESDPAWANGEYKSQPAQGIRTASSILLIVAGAPLNFQALWPERDAAVKQARERVATDMAHRDANDTIYQFDSSRNYDPWPNLEKITAALTWINSADDFVNPRNFPYPQEALQRMPKARFRLVPETPDTHGHGTHTWAINWKADLSELLARSN